MTERPDRETADELMYASEIAALIGVKRTTVSGWKRRYGADFPAPAQIDESGRELFRRRDIEEWLSRRGTGDGSPKRGRRPVTSVSRLESRPPSRQRLPGERRGSGRAGGFLAGISDPEAAFEEALALLDVADVLRRKAAVEAEDDSSDRATPGARTALEDLDVVLAAALRSPASDVLERARASDPERLRDVARYVADALDAGSSADDVAEALVAERSQLSRGASKYGAADRSDPGLARLAAATVDLQPGETVFDPAAGEGGFLVAAVREQPQLRAVGRTLVEGRGPRASRPDVIANLRLRVLGQREPNSGVEAGDSFASAAKMLRPESVDAVICDPPRQSTVPAAFWKTLEVDGPAMRPGPNEPVAEAAAWLLLALKSLRRGGQACVVQSADSLFLDGAMGRIRSHLIENRLVEAIIAPTSPDREQRRSGAGEQGESPSVAADDVLWVLRERQHQGARARALQAPAVLFVEESPETLLARGAGTKSALAALIAEWREACQAGHGVPVHLRVSGGSGAVAVRFPILMESGGNLLPAYWRAATTETPSELSVGFRRAADVVRDAVAEAAQPLEELARVTPVTTVRLQELLAPADGFTTSDLAQEIERIVPEDDREARSQGGFDGPLRFWGLRSIAMPDGGSSAAISDDRLWGVLPVPNLELERATANLAQRGLSHDEIAEQLRVSVEEVRQFLLARAVTAADGRTFAGGSVPTSRGDVIFASRDRNKSKPLAYVDEHGGRRVAGRLEVLRLRIRAGVGNDVATIGPLALAQLLVSASATRVSTGRPRTGEAWQQLEVRLYTRVDRDRVESALRRYLDVRDAAFQSVEAAAAAHAAIARLLSSPSGAHLRFLTEQGGEAPVRDPERTRFT